MAVNSKVVTISEVADYAGVSQATVSRVLNGTAKVREEVSERVRDAIKELGYNPNYAARSLARKRTNTIGIIVSNLHDPFFHDLILGFETGAKDTDYNIIYCSVIDGDIKRKEKYLQYLNNGVVDGVILYGSYLDDKLLIKYLNNDTIRYIMIENDIPEIKCDKLEIDNQHGAEMATEYLIQNGFKLIAHISGKLNVKASIDRMNGYLNAMRSAGLPVENGYLQHAHGGYEDAYDCMKNLVQLEKRPEAVFCSDDAHASYAIRAAIDLGLNVPQDISVIGYDNQYILPGNYTGPSITSVEQPLFDIGKDSIQLMIKQLEDESGTEKVVYKTYETKIVKKESVLEHKEL